MQFARGRALATLQSLVFTTFYTFLDFCNPKLQAGLSQNDDFVRQKLIITQ
jgi:hypothetical protein